MPETMKTAVLRPRLILKPLLALAMLASAFAPAARAAEPERIVAIGGALTEIVYALGRQDAIVAVDATSLYPEQALKDKPSVGYFRNLAAEGILSLRPTRVLAVEGAGPPAALEAVASSGVPVVRIADTPSAEGVAAKIVATGEAVGAPAEARARAEKIAARFAELAREREKITTPKRVLFVIAVQNGRLLCGGKGTAADAVIHLAGGVNAVDFDGYKPLTDEALVAAAPQAIVAMSRDGVIASNAILALPTVAQTPAGQNRRVVDMDGLFLIGFGPRAPDAARAVMAFLYPSLAPEKWSKTPAGAPAAAR